MAKKTAFIPIHTKLNSTFNFDFPFGINSSQNSTEASSIANIRNTFLRIWLLEFVKAKPESIAARKKVFFIAKSQSFWSFSES